MNREQIIFEEIKQLKQSQTNILTFGAGIVGLMFAAIIKLNEAIYGKNVSSEEIYIFIVFNYLVLVVIFPIFSAFLYLLYKSKNKLIQKIAWDNKIFNFNSDILQADKNQESLVRLFLLIVFPFVTYVCLAIYDHSLITHKSLCVSNQICNLSLCWKHLLEHYFCRVIIMICAFIVGVVVCLCDCILPNK